jgi:hypothetical protein
VARRVEEHDLPNARLTCQALPFEKAEDLLPEVMEILATAFEAIPPSVAARLKELNRDDPGAILELLPAFGGLASKLGGGRLRRLAPQILAGTSIVLTDDRGEKERLELGKAEDRSTCFDARPELYIPALWYAGKVTFGRFFPALGKRAPKAPPTTA